MITTKKDVSSHRLLAHDGRISALDLREEYEEAQADDGPAEKHIIVMHDGGTEESTAEMLWFPIAGRAGVAWGAGADWFDASDPEEAALLWVSGEWIDCQ